MPRNDHMLVDDGGECRRRAPLGGGFQAFMQGSKKPQKMFSVLFPWPVCHAKDWCGEHESRANAEEA